MVIQITIDDALIGQLGLADPDSYVRDAVLQRVQQDVFAVQIEQAAQQLQSQVADAVAAGVTVEIQQGSDPKVLAAALEAFDAQAGPLPEGGVGPQGQLASSQPSGLEKTP